MLPAVSTRTVVGASSGRPAAGIAPAIGVAEPVSTDQSPLPSATVLKVTGPLPGMSSVTVICAPGTALPAITGVVSLVNGGEVTVVDPAGGGGGPSLPPPPPPPPPPASASRASPARAGLPENSASGAVGVAIDSGACSTKLPSASAATGSDTWLIVSPSTPPSPSRSSEQGSLGVQTKKKSFS